MLHSELEAMWRGLKVVWDVGIRKLICHSNSKLAIELVSKEVDIYHRYSILVEDIHLLGRFKLLILFKKATLLLLAWLSVVRVKRLTQRSGRFHRLSFTCCFMVTQRVLFLQTLVLILSFLMYKKKKLQYVYPSTPKHLLAKKRVIVWKKALRNHVINQ